MTRRGQLLAGPASECLPPFSSERGRIWVLARGGEVGPQESGGTGFLRDMCVVLSSAFIKGLTASSLQSQLTKMKAACVWSGSTRFTVYSHSANMPGAGDTTAYDVKARALVELVV